MPNLSVIPFGPHFLNEGFDVTRAMLEQLVDDTPAQKSLMKVIKFAEMDLDWLRDPNKLALLDLAQAKGCIVVGRRVAYEPDIEAQDMKLEARKWIDGQGGNHSLLQMAQAFPQVQYWEGPNEIDINHDQPNCAQRMKNYAEFCVEFARLMKSEAKRSVAVGAWSTGTPEFDLWRYWVPVLEACRTYGAVLTRHNYGPLDEWYAFRHRQDEDTFRSLGFSGTPLIISECGTDYISKANAFNKPWRKLWGYADNAIDRYWGEYLKLLVAGLLKDAYVLGATVFTAGNGGSWNDHDVAHTDLAGAILRNYPDVPKPPDPVPAWATHQVTASVLNVRMYPWLSDVVPPTVGSLLKGAYVRVTDVAKTEAMSIGWYHVGPDRWVSGSYLKKVN